MYQHLNTRKRHLAAAIALASVSAASAAETGVSVADEKDQKIEMIQVVGQATGGLDNLITLEKIENLQANNLGDLFKLDATISAGGPTPLSQKVYIRNIGEDAINITIDGAELSAGVFHHSGRVLLEPELLKQVEIEAGTGSAAAGFGALGGALRFTTKDPEDLLRLGQNVGAFVKSAYHSNGEGWKNTVSLYGQDDRGVFSGMVSFTKADMNNLEDANGDLLDGTESDRELGYVKLVANISPEQYLSLSYEKLEEEGDILYKPEWILGDNPNDNWISPTKGTRDTVIFNYGFDSVDNDLLDFSVNLYKTESEHERIYDAKGYYGDVLGRVETLGATIKNTSVLGNHKLTLGINYRDDDAELEESVEGEDGKVKALFIQDVAEVTDKLTITAGLRYDDYELNDWQNQKISDSAVSPNLSANYKITDSLHLSAGYAEAIRGAEIVDAYKINANFNDPDLKAQKGKNKEIGLDYYGGNFHLAAGIYRTEIKDVLGSPVPWSKVVINLEDEIEIDGFYLKGDFQFDRLTLSASYHNSDSEAGGQDVVRYVYGSTGTSIGDTLALSMDYAFTENWQAGWIAEFVKGMHNLDVEVAGSPLELDKPGYGVHDIYVKWTGLEDDRLAVSLTVKNVLDKQYIDHASAEDYRSNPGYSAVSGHPEPGRDIYLSASLKF